MPRNSSAETHLPPSQPDRSAVPDGTREAFRSARQTLGAALRDARGSVSLRDFTDAVMAKMPAGGPSVNHVLLWRIENGQVRTPNPAVIKACDAAAGTGDRLQAIAASTLSTPAAAPHVPAASDGFVGRRDEWGKLDALLDRESSSRCGILSLTGLPGAGKTAVVVQWYHATAQRIAAQFPAVCWVDLGGYSRDIRPLHPDAALELLLHQLMQQLNQASKVPTKGARRAQMYYRLCSQHPVLVVLDNAATAQQVLPLIPPSPQCRVVVTSRTYLEQLVTERGADSVTLPPLAAQESHQLLHHWVGDRIMTAPTAAARVAALCGNLPMALILAGEHLQRLPRLPVQELAERLEQDGRLDLLATDNRHIWGAFLLSYRVLSAEAREVFRLLGLHPSPEIAVEGARTLTGRTVTDIQAQMDALVAARLLEQVSHDRYRFHDLLQKFAAELAQQEDSDNTRAVAIDRILHYYLDTAAAAAKTVNPKLRLPVAEPAARFPNHFDAIQWLTVERSNLHAAAHLALRRGEPALCWHLAVVQGWHVPAACTSWHNTHLLGLRAARDSGDALGAAWCMHHLGLYHAQLREWQDAEEYLGQALVRWCLIGDRDGQARTLWAQAYTYAEQGLHAAALDLYQELLDEVEDDCLRAVVQASMGGAYCALPDPNPEAAVNCLQEALAYFIEESIPTAEAVALMRLAEAWRQLGNRGKALRLLNRAYACYAGIGATTGLADVLLRQAPIEMASGDLTRARSAAISARAMFAEVGDPRTADADEVLVAIADIAP